MFGLDDIAIAGIIASLAGAGMQYKANSDAADRAEEETRRSIARQQEFQKQAEAKALQQAKQFTTDDRKDKQGQLEQELTQEFVKPAESAQEINNAQTTTQGAVSDDYTAAKAKSNLETLKSARTLAALLGKTTAASRLRGNEAIDMADTAAGIDRLGSFSRGQAGADQLAIQAAARPDAGMMLGGSLLSGIGSAGMSGAFSGTKAAGDVGSIGAGLPYLGNAPKTFTTIPKFSY